jgi:hypothetical protein
MAEITREAANLIEGQVRSELERREKKDPVSFFPWHRIQRWCIDTAFTLAKKDVRVVLACGGNRGGKSALGKGVYSRFMRRMSPLSAKLRTTDRLTGDVRRKNDTDPVTVWIVPPTLEKARQDWVNPSDGYSIRYWLGDLFIDEKKSPDHVFYSRPPGMSQEVADIEYAKGNVEMLDKTILKSHDQDILSFEASAVDLCIVDEELQDESKWNSMLLRIGTTNGTLIMCYTPLHGLTWTYDRYWRPLVKMEIARQEAERCWIHDDTQGACVVAVQFGAADNPLAREYSHEVESDPGMSDAEKGARLYGEYGFVEGALVPLLAGMDLIAPDADHAIYILDELPKTIIEWNLVTDPNKSYGAVLSCLDDQGNIVLVQEHLEEAWPDRRHAEAFQKMERKYVPPGSILHRRADPGSAGAHSIVNMADLGVFFEAVEKGAGSVSEGVKKMRSYSWVDPEHVHPITGKLGAPRLYFYRPGMISTWKDTAGRTALGCRTADQISLARQTDNKNAPPDTPHKTTRSKLDLFDCVRYTVMSVRFWQDDTDDRKQTRKDDYHLPKLPLKGMNDDTDIWEQDFYQPEYDF